MPGIYVCLLGGGFWASGRFAGVPGVTLAQMSYGSETTTRRPAHERYIAILAPGTGHIEVFHRGQGHIVSAGRSLAVLAPGEQVHMRWTAGSEVFALVTDTHALRTALEAVAPHADDRPLRFRSPVLDLRSGAAVCGAVHHLLADVFSQYRSTADIPHRITHVLADQALSALLLSLEHNHSDEIRRRVQPSGSRRPSTRRSSSSTPRPTRPTPFRI